MAKLLLRERLRAFLEEDLIFGDTTTDLVIKPKEAQAEVVTHEDGVIAGVEEASELLDMCGVEVIESVKDGTKVSSGDIILRIKGVNCTILMVERTMLNLLSRMSGIATMTTKMSEIAHGVNPKVRVAATRKTAPGLRWFDKKAVALGGGDTHRMSLHDSILIKDNHIAEVGDLVTCIERARSGVSFVRKVEVEVGNPEDAVDAARAGADMVMLDNMSLTEMKQTLSVLRDEGLREQVLVEASGNISLDNLAQVAATGVDVVSIGSLTHSPRSLDIALRFIE